MDYSNNHDQKDYYQVKGRGVIQKLKNSSVYFQQSSSSSSLSSPSTLILLDRQKKSVQVSLRNFHRILKKILHENHVPATSNDLRNNKKKNHWRDSNGNEDEIWIVVDAVRQFKRLIGGGRPLNIPSSCLENLDRAIRDSVQLSMQQNQEDNPTFLKSIGILNECMETLQSIVKDRHSPKDDDDYVHDPEHDVDPMITSDVQAKPLNEKDDDDDPFVRRGSEVVQELLFSSPYFTPKLPQEKQKQRREYRSSSSKTTKGVAVSPDKQYDSYKVSDQKYKATIQKYLPSHVFQRGNTNHILDSIEFLKANPKIIRQLLQTDTEIVFDLQRARNDRVFVAIHKFYVTTEEGDCFYKGNASHLRYIGILDYAHETLSGLTSRTESIWNIV